MAVDSQGTAPGQEVITAVITHAWHHPTLRRLKNDRRCQIPVAQVGRARVRHPRRSDTPAMFEPDLGPMPDDDDDELNDELNDIGLLTREAPAAKTTKAKSAPREKPAPKSSAWELTGNAELDALFQSSTLTARSLNVAASRPSTTGPSQGKPLRSTPVEVPISRAEKILAKLAEQKEEDDKESKKLDRQRKRVEDDAKAEAAAASARAAAEAHDARVEAQLAGAIQLGRDVKEKAARVEAALADAGDGSDETPSPRDVARALRDDAFEPDTHSRPGSDPRDSCVANMPRSVRDAPSDASAIANAAEADAKRRGADAGDAVAHALREAIVGGWLEQRFLIARRDGEAAGAAGGGGGGEAKGLFAGDVRRRRRHALRRRRHPRGRLARERERLPRRARSRAAPVRRGHRAMAVPNGDGAVVGERRFVGDDLREKRVVRVARFRTKPRTRAGSALALRHPNAPRAPRGALADQGFGHHRRVGRMRSRRGCRRPGRESRKGEPGRGGGGRRRAFLADGGEAEAPGGDDDGR